MAKDNAALTARTKTFALKAGAMEGNTIRGIASVAGVLDSYDDVIMPGALSESVLAEFRASGFVADSHDWRSMVAMPTVAEVRGVELYTEAEFHSTEDAQAVRTKCAERIERGLSVGLSIGFMMAPAAYKSFTSGDALLKWAEATGYSLADLDTETIRACKRRCQAITEISRLIEYSVVAIPANPASWATEVKTADGIAGDRGPELSVPEFTIGSAIEYNKITRKLTGTPPAAPGTVFRGEYLGPWAEADAAYSALCSLTYDLKYGPVWDALFGYGICSAMTPAERMEYLVGAYTEYTDLSLRIAAALMELIADAAPADPLGEDDDSDDMMEMGVDALDTIRRTFFPAPSPIPAGEAPAALLASQADTVRDAVEALAARSAAVLALRRADGRTLSAATRERIGKSTEALRAICDTLRQIEAESTPTDYRAEVRKTKAEILRTLHRTR